VKLRDLGCYEISLGDTIGVGTPGGWGGDTNDGWGHQLGGHHGWGHLGGWVPIYLPTHCKKTKTSSFINSTLWFFQ